MINEPVLVRLLVKLTLIPVQKKEETFEFQVHWLMS